MALLEGEYQASGLGDSNQGYLKLFRSRAGYGGGEQSKAVRRLIGSYSRSSQPPTDGSLLLFIGDPGHPQNPDGWYFQPSSVITVSFESRGKHWKDINNNIKIFPFASKGNRDIG